VAEFPVYRDDTPDGRDVLHRAGDQPHRDRQRSRLAPVERLMAAEAVPPPTMPGWMFVFNALFIALCVFNLWRFRTGWRYLGEHYRPGVTEFAIRTGYASVPFLVASVAWLLMMVTFQVVVDHRTTLMGYLFMLWVAVFLGGILVGAKETKRPSRWNKTPAWLADATARGEAGTDVNI
jgi:hypothetical protein